MLKLRLTLLAMIALCSVCPANLASAAQILSAEFDQDGKILGVDDERDKWIQSSGKVDRNGLIRYEVVTQPGRFSLMPRCWCTALLVTESPAPVTCKVSPQSSEQVVANATKVQVRKARKSGFANKLVVRLSMPILTGNDDGKWPTIGHKAIFEEWFIVFCESSQSAQ